MLLHAGIANEYKGSKVSGAANMIVRFGGQKSRHTNTKCNRLSLVSCVSNKDRTREQLTKIT